MDRVTKVRLVASVFGIAIAAIGLIMTLGWLDSIVDRIIVIYYWLVRASTIAIVSLAIIGILYNLLRWIKKN